MKSEILSLDLQITQMAERRSNQFDLRYDLYDLAKEAEFYRIVPRDQDEEFTNTFQMLNLRWRSNQRFYSQRQFLDYMNEISAVYNTKGDRWKNMSRKLLSLADNVIRQGENKWNSR